MAVVAVPSQATAAPTLPCGPGWPRVVQTWVWFNHPDRLLRHCRRRYGANFTVRVSLGNNLVMLSDPALVRAVFTGDNDALHAGEANAEILEPVVGPRSVLVLDGPEHLRQRKLMLPAFHGERMRAWGETIDEIARTTLAAVPRDQTVTLRPVMQRLTLTVILKLIFGVDASAERHQVLVTEIAQLSELGRHPFRIFMFGEHELGGLSPWGRFVRSRRRLDRAIHAEISARRRASDLSERTDVLSQLISSRDAEGTAMSDGELRDELVTLLLAGHETTATALAWAMDLLLHSPRVLARLRAELAAGDASGYLDAVIRETMRLRPPILLVDRIATRPVAIGPLHLPRGASICPNIYLSHRNPDVYPHPDRFHPERFLGAAAEPYSWLPFGGGIRRCLGASFATYEMRRVLPILLNEMDISAASPRRARLHREAVIVVPHDGVRVRIAAGVRNSTAV